MCFKSSNKGARLQYQATMQQIAEQKKLQAKESAERAAQHKEQLKLQEKQGKFQAEQNKQIMAQQAEALKLAERPAAVATSETAGLATGGSGAEGEANVDAVRRGRRALRIDMNAPQTGGGQTGINVPRG